MKPGGVVSLKKINSLSFLFKNRLFLLICISLISGIIIGGFSLSGGNRAEILFERLFRFYITGRQEAGFFTVIFSSLIVYVPVCIGYFVFGTSIVGVVLSPILCCAVGIYFSGMAALAYSKFALRGVAFNAIILIPAAISFCICAFFAAKESFRFSTIIIKLTLPKSRPLNISSEFKTYCGKFIIIILLCIIAAIIDAAVSVSFLRYFSF